MFSLDLCFFLCLISSIICDNIDTQFPIIFSYQKSARNFKLNDISGSHFGYSLVANQLEEENM